MASPLKFLDSSIGKKVLMSLTGIFLCTFLIVHVSGNLQLFQKDQGLAFNEYSLFMTTFVPIKVISYILYACIVLHAIMGIRVTLQNRSARPIGYKAPKDNRSATWASKNMALLGIVVLIFLVTHMANFWYKYKFGDVPFVEYKVNPASGEVISKAALEPTADLIPHHYIVTDSASGTYEVIVLKDLYEVVKVAFMESWLVALYLIGMIALAYHMVHGFQSSFQTLGLRHKTYTPIISAVGVWVFGIIIPLLFAAMPVYFFFS